MESLTKIEQEALIYSADNLPDKDLMMPAEEDTAVENN